MTSTRAAEGDVLLAKAQDGDPASWSALALLLRRDLEVVAALYAADWNMVEVVCEECWPLARRWINEQRQPQQKSGFLLGATSATAAVMTTLREQAIPLLRQLLAAYDDQAIAARDAVPHLIAQAGLESLPRTGGEVPDAAPSMQQRLGRLTQSTQNLLARRYRAGQSSAQIADEVGHPWDTIAVALAQARSALDWDNEAARLDQTDRQLPLLIEQFIDGNLQGELRSGLAQQLLADLDRTAGFVRQIRLDLVLSAIMHAERHDAAALLRERGAPTPGSGPKRPATASYERPSERVSERVPTPEARPPTARGGKARREDAGNTRLWLMVGGGVAVLVVIGLAVGLSRPAKAPRPAPTPTVDTPAPTPSPARPTPAATDVGLRVESGQPAVMRDGVRQRLQPGATLRAQEAFTTDTSIGPVVLSGGGGRKLTVGVNSNISGMQLGSVSADVIALTNGNVRVEAAAGARPMAVRVGTTTATGDGASFTVTTISDGQRIEAARGLVRLQRGGKPFGVVLAGQVGTVNAQGELVVVSLGAFVMGIDLAGNGGVIEGRRWKSQRHADADGLSVTGHTFLNGSVPGESDARLRALVENGLGGGALRLTQLLPDGSYDVVCWVAGPVGNAPAALTVDGQSPGDVEAVGGDVARFGANGWRRLWPRRCLVTGGRLSLGFAGNDQQRLAGVMIQAVSAEAGGTAARLPPTVFLDHPFDGLTRTAPVQVTCKVELHAPGEAVRVVEYFANDAKIGEATALPYTFSWSIANPGNYRLTARALTANGLSAASDWKNVTVRPAGDPIAALPTTAAPGALLSVADFERVTPDWEYVGGWEFPGAAGSSARDAGLVHSGNHAYRLDYDFSGGGAYVGTWAKLEHLVIPDATEIRFWVLTSLDGLGLRVVDGSGQLHQSRITLQRTTDWQEVVVKITDAVGGEHWGGANDGKWHKGIKGVGINVGRGNGNPVGTLWIDDFSVRVAP